MSSDPVSSNGVQCEAFKRRQSTKKVKSQPHPWKTIDFGGRENHELLVMLRQRELFGPRAVHARQLTRIRRSAQLNSMAASSSAKAFELVKHGVFLGLSHDSRFVVAQVKNGADGTFTSTSSLDFNFDDDDSEDTQSLVLCELSPKRLVPRVVVPMRVASLCYIYAFLPKDSSILAAMAFPCDQMAPYARDPTPTTTVQTSIELVLLKHEALHLSAKLNVLTSCRWRLPKLTRHPLRVYENGIIVNTGTTVVALRFGKAVETDFFVPSLWSDTDTCNRNMWAVTSESNVGGAALQGGMLQNLLAEMPSGDAHEPLTLRQLANGEPLHSKTLLVLTETWLEIEPIIDQVAKSVCACTDISYAGLIDYEADVLSVEDTSAGILISCVIEATPSPMLTQLPSNYLLVFDIVWNSRTAHVDHLNIWPGLKPISRAVARSPSMWYPFTSMCRKPSVEEIPLSNSPFMKGKSLERLIGYFGGISLVR